jgi:hypothetical protein
LIHQHHLRKLLYVHDVLLAGEGWQSGTIPAVATQCTGLSSAMCSSCQKTKNPTACIACARRKDLQVYGAVGFIGVNQPLVGYCAECANITNSALQSQ